MANTKEVNQVVAAFERWRATRGSRKSPTPQALRKQAIDLLEHCSSSKITSMLRISGSQLKQWRGSVKPEQTNRDFIRLPVQDGSLHSVNQHPSIVLRLCNGATLTFSDEVSQTLLVAMLKEANL